MTERRSFQPNTQIKNRALLEERIVVNNPLFLCVISALGFGSWPLIARTTTINPGWLSIAICLGTMMTSSVTMNRALPNSKAFLILIGAGMINGIGLLAYSKLLTMQNTDVSRLIPIAVALGAVTTAVGACIVFGEPITIRKVSGVGLAFVAVYLLH